MRAYIALSLLAGAAVIVCASAVGYPFGAPLSMAGATRGPRSLFSFRNHQPQSQPQQQAPAFDYQAMENLMNAQYYVPPPNNFMAPLLAAAAHSHPQMQTYDAGFGPSPSQLPQPSFATSSPARGSYGQQAPAITPPQVPQAPQAPQLAPQRSQEQQYSSQSQQPEQLHQQQHLQQPLQKPQQQQLARSSFLSDLQIIDTSGRVRNLGDFGLEAGGQYEPELTRHLMTIFEAINKDLEHANFLPITVPNNGQQQQGGLQLHRQASKGGAPQRQPPQSQTPVEQQPFEQQEQVPEDEPVKGAVGGYTNAQPPQTRFQFLRPTKASSPFQSPPRNEPVVQQQQQEINDDIPLAPVKTLRKSAEERRPPVQNKPQQQVQQTNLEQADSFDDLPQPPIAFAALSAPATPLPQQQPSKQNQWSPIVQQEVPLTKGGAAKKAQKFRGPIAEFVERGKPRLTAPIESAPTPLQQSQQQQDFDNQEPVFDTKQAQEPLSPSPPPPPPQPQQQQLPQEEYVRPAGKVARFKQQLSGFAEKAKARLTPGTYTVIGEEFEAPLPQPPPPPPPPPPPQQQAQFEQQREELPQPPPQPPAKQRKIRPFKQQIVEQQPFQQQFQLQKFDDESLPPVKQLSTTTKTGKTQAQIQQTTTSESSKTSAVEQQQQQEQEVAQQQPIEEAPQPPLKTLPPHQQQQSPETKNANTKGNARQDKSIDKTKFKLSSTYTTAVGEKVTPLVVEEGPIQAPQFETEQQQQQVQQQEQQSFDDQRKEEVPLQQAKQAQPIIQQQQIQEQQEQIQEQQQPQEQQPEPQVREQQQQTEEDPVKAERRPLAPAKRVQQQQEAILQQQQQSQAQQASKVAKLRQTISSFTERAKAKFSPTSTYTVIGEETLPAQPAQQTQGETKTATKTTKKTKSRVQPAPQPIVEQQKVEQQEVQVQQQQQQQQEEPVTQVQEQKTVQNQQQQQEEEALVAQTEAPVQQREQQTQQELQQQTPEQPQQQQQQQQDEQQNVQVQQQEEVQQRQQQVVEPTTSPPIVEQQTQQQIEDKAQLEQQQQQEVQQQQQQVQQQQQEPIKQEPELVRPATVVAAVKTRQAAAAAKRRAKQARQSINGQAKNVQTADQLLPTYLQFEPERITPLKE